MYALYTHGLFDGACLVPLFSRSVMLLTAILTGVVYMATTYFLIGLEIPVIEILRVCCLRHAFDLSSRHGSFSPNGLIESCMEYQNYKCKTKRKKL